jgi:hypothetical protein
MIAQLNMLAVYIVGGSLFFAFEFEIAVKQL